MREIKFRAWNKYAKKMQNPAFITFEGVCMDYSQEPGEGLDNCSDEYVLMQYTGLRDKNGVEIYEGDIVDAKTYPVHLVVIWSFGACGFVVNDYAIDDGTYLAELCRADLEGLSVIGNIYSNPKLLEQEKETNHAEG